ncbi:hypothetical protein BDV3_001302 [Batrachochytrium dendrobatidis]|nr:hypothetical protein O5D80_002312 [Batrachochytrium dendrobatidis]KAK5668564.1 hypothetical protein QVD99_005573 [Batrachochytrium dendrobatidis]
MVNLESRRSAPTHLEPVSALSLGLLRFYYPTSYEVSSTHDTVAIHCDDNLELTHNVTPTNTHPIPSIRPVPV